MNKLKLIKKIIFVLFWILVFQTGYIVYKHFNNNSETGFTEFKKKYYGRKNNPNKMSYEEKIWLNVQKYSDKYEIDPILVLAIMACGSGFTHDIKSVSNAYGLMQIIPSTAKSLKVDSNKMDENIKGGIKFIYMLKQQFAKVEPDLKKKKLIIAAYNSGIGNVRKYGGVPLFKETRRYVKNVLSLYEKYSKAINQEYVDPVKLIKQEKKRLTENFR